MHANIFETNIKTQDSKNKLKSFIPKIIVDYISSYPTFHLDSTSETASSKSSLLESEGEEGYSSLGGTYVLKNSFQSESHSDSDSDKDSCCLVLDLV